MSDSSGYTAVVAVKHDNIDFGTATCFCICSVPNGAIVNSGDMVFYGAFDSRHNRKGICVSDTLYLPQDTLEMVCRVTNTPIETMPTIHGKASIEWYATRKESAIEQTLL